MPYGFIKREVTRLELGVSHKQYDYWEMRGYLPPPITVTDGNGEAVELIPANEWRYTTALLAAGKDWSLIKSAVSRMVQYRSHATEDNRPVCIEAGEAVA